MLTTPVPTAHSDTASPTQPSVPTAKKATSTDPSSRAAAAFRMGERLYVDRAARSVLTDDEVRDITDRLERAVTPIYIAVLAEHALDKTGGDGTLLAAEIHDAAGNPDGTVAVLAGNTLVAGSTVLGRGAGDIAADVARRFTKPADRLIAFADEIELAVSPPPTTPDEKPEIDHGWSGGVLVAWLLLGLLVAAAGWVAYGRRRLRDEEAGALRLVRKTVDDDITTYGLELRALDSRLRVTSADPPTRGDYGRALGAYERAKQAAFRTGHLDDVAAVTAALEEGRYALASARARLAGEPVPAHRPPCLFDPQHGPADRKVAWSPPGSDTRLVPCCTADARRFAANQAPDVRMVRYGDRMRPYWDAGSAYASWAQGWYAAHGRMLLSTLLYGTPLGDVWNDPTTPTPESPLDDLVPGSAEP